METTEQIQELIDLTPNQKAAWTQLVRAVNRCRKENIYFYQVLCSMNGLNGNHIKRVVPIEETDFSYVTPRNLQNLTYPCVETADAWADDTHVVILKTD